MFGSLWFFFSNLKKKCFKFISFYMQSWKLHQHQVPVITDCKFLFKMESCPIPTDAQALEAILSGNIDILEKLLQKGTIDINHKIFGNGQTLLYNAVVSDNKEIVKILLNRGAIVNSKNVDDESPLHKAVCGCQKAMIRILLEANADVNAKNKLGQTPLHLAILNSRNKAWKNNKDIVKLLINKGADPNIKTKHGETPLYEAASNSNLKLTKILLENGADINSTTARRTSVLHRAVSSGNKDIVQLLISNGANVHSKTEQGETVLHRAIWNDKDSRGGWKANREIVELLLKNNVDVNAQTNDGRSVLSMAVCRQRETLLSILHRSTCGWRPHFKADSRNLTEITEILLNKGADINFKTKNGTTALYLAALEKNIEMVRLLLNRGADVNAKTSDGNSVISLAVWHENIDLVKLLFAHGADIINATIHGNTILNTAIRSGRRDIVNVLLDNGADINVPDSYGYTALHEAAQYGFLELVKYLVMKGVKVDAKNEKGDTPLHQVVQRDYRNEFRFGRLNSKEEKIRYYTTTKSVGTDIINILLTNNADIEAKNKNHETPLFSAVAFNNLFLVDVLLDHGADLTVPDSYGNTALHQAAYNGFSKLAENLIVKGAKVDARNTNGDTPLHRATQHYDYHFSTPASTDIINILLKNNADIEAKNKSHETPLFCAVTHNKLSFVDFLLDNEADINHKSNCGLTCLNSRAATGETLSEEMTTLLKRHIIRRKCAGLYLNKENLKKYPFNMFEYQTECNKEILYLKSEFIHDGISLFDLLSKPTSQLTYYLRYSDITKSINLSKFKTNSKQYYNMIYSKFQNAMRRKELLEYGEMFFNSLHVSLPILPYVCREHILSYLSNADLLILKNIF